MTITKPSKGPIERNLIGCLCYDPTDALFAVEQAGVTAATFADPRNRHAFLVAREIVHGGKHQLDEHTLAAALHERGFENADAYCREVFERGQNLTAIPTYAKLLKLSELRREMKQIAAELEAQADDPHAEIEAIRAHAESRLMGLAIDRRTVSWSDACRTRATMWTEARGRTVAGGPGVIGVPFVADGLNRLLGGARRGRVTVVAAPEKGGKTIWWGNEAIGQAQQGIRVAAWCGEMTQDEIGGREAARLAGLSSFALDTGCVRDTELANVTAMLDEISGLPITMSDDPMDIDELCSWLRRVSAKDKAEIAYIDHLDLIDGRGNDYERVSNNIKRLRELALQINMPVVCMHQLSRAYQKENRPPDQRDLRDSGKITHNGYSVSVFYQDTYGSTHDESKIVWNVFLNRGGPTGICLFHRRFDTQSMPECTREEKESWMRLKGWKTGDE